MIYNYEGDDDVSHFESPISALVDNRTKVRLEWYKSSLKGESIAKKISPNIVSRFNNIEKGIRENQVQINRMSTAMTMQKSMPVINAARDAFDNIQKTNMENMRTISQSLNTDYLSNIASTITSYQKVTADLTPALAAISSFDNDFINRIQSSYSIIQETLNNLNATALSTFSDALKDMYNVSEMMSRSFIYQTSMLTIDDLDDETSKHIDINQLKRWLILNAAKGYLYLSMGILIYSAVTDGCLFSLLYTTFGDPIKKKSKKYIEEYNKDEE